jgi:hypothetical protein
MVIIDELPEARIIGNNNAFDVSVHVQVGELAITQQHPASELQKDVRVAPLE